MKKICACALLASLTLSLAVPVRAAPEDGPELILEATAAEEADVAYTGTAIDPFQGSSFAAGTEDGMPAGSRIAVSGGVWYDPAEKVYILNTGSGEMTANVVNDMVTTETVSIALGDEVRRSRPGAKWP